MWRVVCQWAESKWCTTWNTNYVKDEINSKDEHNIRIVHCSVISLTNGIQIAKFLMPQIFGGKTIKIDQIGKFQPN
ncbi:hypothetical protein BLOT_007485 [Blomia tropicalis]|nr:hypothetical protein BLOT_007485 [Blomia tropicalis]